MKLLITLTLSAALFASCFKHEAKPAESEYKARIAARAQTYKALIAALPDGPYSLTERCDGLTFIGLFDAAAPGAVDIYAHRYGGTWHRSTRPCFPEDSRSEISFENMLGAIHAMLSRKDIEGIRKVYNYGEENGWVFGEGPEEYTRLYQLRPLLSDFLLGKLRAGSDAMPSLEGYRGNVVADYIALKGRMFGYVRTAELAVINTLKDANPENPLYQIMSAKYGNGDFETAFNILLDESLFPVDALPEKSLTIFGWSDGPAAILYLWADFLIREP